MLHDDHHMRGGKLEERFKVIVFPRVTDALPLGSSGGCTSAHTVAVAAEMATAHMVRE